MGYYFISPQGSYLCRIWVDIIDREFLTRSYSMFDKLKKGKDTVNKGESHLEHIYYIAMTTHV